MKTANLITKYAALKKECLTTLLQMIKAKGGINLEEISEEFKDQHGNIITGISIDNEVYSEDRDGIELGAYTIAALSISEMIHLIDILERQ